MEKNGTEIKSLQNLFKSKELYQNLIENKGDALFFTQELHIIECNEAAVLMFGFTPNEELSDTLRNEARDFEITTIEQYAGIINSTSMQTFRLLENLLDWSRHQWNRWSPQGIIL